MEGKALKGCLIGPRHLKYCVTAICSTSTRRSTSIGWYTVRTDIFSWSVRVVSENRSWLPFWKWWGLGGIYIGIPNSEIRVGLMRSLLENYLGCQTSRPKKPCDRLTWRTIPSVSGNTAFPSSRLVSDSTERPAPSANGRWANSLLALDWSHLIMMLLAETNLISTQN